MLHPPLVKHTSPIETQLPLEERIQARAYELYVLRGNESGSEMDDWLQAEDEIHAEHDEARNADRAHWPQPITRTAK